VSFQSAAGWQPAPYMKALLIVKPILISVPPVWGAAFSCFDTLQLT
jgi:hypothetical protein